MTTYRDPKALRIRCEQIERRIRQETVREREAARVKPVRLEDTADLERKVEGR